MRLLLSASAIVLGVAFVAGSFIFTDTLGRAFTTITTGSVGDVIVDTGRSGGSGPDADAMADDGAAPEAPDESPPGTNRTVPASLVPRIAEAPGVARVDGNIIDYTTFVVGADGKLIGGLGAPGIAVNHTGGPAAHGVELATIVEGRWPTAAGEVALDETSAAASGHEIGDPVRFVTTGEHPTHEATLVGTMRYGNGGLIGASIAAVDTKTAQELFLDGKDEFSNLWVTAAAGTSQEQLAEAVQRVVGPGYRVQTGDVVAEKVASSINKALTFINTFLLVFAGIALLVGSFLIVNTFSILVAQRSRELALLRALGARRAQVTRSVVLEAIVVGAVGSVLGIVGGAGLAWGIRALFGRFGLDLSGTPLVFEPRTVLVSAVVGIVVTVIAAYLPARRAGAVAPVAAMRDDASIDEGSMRRRVVVGVSLTLGGLAALGYGSFIATENTTWWLGAGIVATMVGAALANPVLGRPVTAGLGAAYRRMFGAVGHMATENAIRNPRRTAATASALMIGLALVAMMSVFGASAKASVDDTIRSKLSADYVISNPVGLPFSHTITEEVAAVPGVGEVATARFTGAVIDGERHFVAAVDPATFPQVAKTDVVEGSLTDLDADGLAISDRVPGLGLGDEVDVSIRGATRPMRVVAVYSPAGSLSQADHLISLEAHAAFGLPALDNITLVTRAPGATAAEVHDGISAVVKNIPTVSVMDQDAFAAQQRAPIDQLLYIIYALLGLAVVIAILGIINTLALSVIERTREIGLLRAVGLSRRQLRTMIRLESVIIAVLGAVVGVVLGLVFGIAIQRALVDDGITVLAIPGVQLAGFVALAVVVGVLAALWPGRRAGRLDILTAIGTE